MCEKQHKLNPKLLPEGIYVGETSRTLAERAEEHRAALRRLDSNSFMFKHWVLKYNMEKEAPKFVFEVF